MALPAGTRSWIAVLFMAGVLAAAMSCGTLHRFQGSDSIVPVLVSLQRWTPFFWQQDRFGMLIPLVAMPVSNPLMNLALQGWIMTAAALLAPFLVARLLIEATPRGNRDGDDASGGPDGAAALEWLAAGAVANVLLLLLVDDFVRFDWFVVQPYALSATLAAAALLASDRRSRIALLAAPILMMLAHWVNVGIVVLAAPLAVLRRRAILRSVANTGLGAAAGVALTGLTAYHTTTAVVSPLMWPRAWRELVIRAQQAFPNLPALFVTVTVASILTMVLTMRARRDPRDLQRLTAAAIALSVALIYWLAAGTSRWVQLNIFLPRYIYPSLLMCGVAAGIVAAASVRADSRVLSAAAALSLSALTLIDYGVPSPGRLAAVLDARLGALTPDILATRATVIGGNYWAVWPAVFHANLAQYRTRGPAVYGFTYRSAATDDLWKRRAGIVLAAPAGDASIHTQARRAGLTISRIGRHGTVDVYAIQRR